MARAVSVLVGLIALLLTGTALACTPAPSPDPFEAQRREQRMYLAEVTTIYTGVFERVVGRQDDPIINFTIRKTADVWGEPGPIRWALRFETGSCAKYFPFLIDWDEGQGPRNGMAVTVFVTPAARGNPELMYIQPSGPYSETMLSQWRALRTNGH